MTNATHQMQKRLRPGIFATAIVSFLAFSWLSAGAHAASLGKIVVFSSLGQPLRAEIAVSASREEIIGMKAQLASPDAFKQLQIERTATLSGIRFTLDKRTNGQAVVTLKSDRPINDPFIDVLLELNWPNGRLIREYTFLLDPPELLTKNVAPVTLAKPAESNQDDSLRSEAAGSASSIDDALRKAALASVNASEPVQSTPGQSAEQKDSHEVKRGDNMQKIARETKPEGVSLEQMLIGLWQANPTAFDGGNMNRLKVGKMLWIPEKPVLEAISTKDARNTIAAQTADWNSYRRKLSADVAQRPSGDDIGQQGASGKIVPRVEDTAAPAEGPKDQVKISRTETVRSQRGAKARFSDEDLIAKDKALRETNERIVMLEKITADMQRLIELKNQQLAALQRQTAANTETREIQVKPENVATASAASIEPALTSAAKPAAQPTNQQARKPGAIPEQKVTLPQEPVRTLSLWEKLLGNPLLMAGATLLALLALFAGFIFNRRRVSRRSA